MIPTNLGMNLDEATYKRNEKNNFISHVFCKAKWKGLK